MNDTKIQYLKVGNKIYKVTSLYWQNTCLEAKETDLTAADVEENKLWDISYFEDFHIRLINWKGEAEIVDFADGLKVIRNNG